MVEIANTLSLILAFSILGASACVACFVTLIEILIKIKKGK